MFEKVTTFENVLEHTVYFYSPQQKYLMYRIFKSAFSYAYALSNNGLENGPRHEKMCFRDMQKV